MKIKTVLFHCYDCRNDFPSSEMIVIELDEGWGASPLVCKSCYLHSLAHIGDEFELDSDIPF